MAELQGLAQGELKDLLGAGGEGDVARGRRLALTDHLDDLGAHRVQGDLHGLQRLSGHALALVDESKEEVLCADVGVVERPSLVLGQDDDTAGSVGKAFEHR